MEGGSGKEEGGREKEGRGKEGAREEGMKGGRERERRRGCHILS